jgi:hypothetical protein
LMQMITVHWPNALPLLVLLPRDVLSFELYICILSYPHWSWKYTQIWWIINHCCQSWKIVGFLKFAMLQCYSAAMAVDWRHFIVNSVSCNNSDLFKFKYTIALHIAII